TALLVLVVAGTGTWWFVRSTERREREYRDLISAAPVPMGVQRDGVFRFVNDAFARLVGAGDPSELEGASALEYLPATDHGQIRDRIRRAQAGERAETRERRWIRPDGGERVTKVTGIPVEYGGEPSALVIAQDVTDERRARRRLRRSEEKFRSLFEASQDAIYLSRPDGTIEELNPAGRELLGYSEEEIREIDAVELYRDPGERERFKRAITEEGGVQEFEVDLVTRDGDVRHCELAATARRDEDGEVIGYQGIIRDVTERKRFEEELEWQALHDGLTGLANRTLLWDRLEQAVARAERTGEKVGVVFVD
ncbi:MAG: PAS domain S-box protein, partial [Gemmatimonadota bacterium]